MWEFNGIRSDVEKPAPVGAYEHTNQACLILGGSKKVWEDYKEARSLFDRVDDYHIFAINDIAALFKAERIDGIVSLHGEICGALRTLRKVRIEGHCVTHSNKPHDGVDIVWGHLNKEGGTSALFTAKMLIAMGYKKIILCGCGLDMTGHFYDPEQPEDNKNGWFDEACRSPWKRFIKENEHAKDRVRFMSGELSKVYGRPSKDWIYEMVEV